MVTYVQLGRLEKAGLVARQESAGASDGPDRKVYQLTPAGQERVTEWLSEVSWPKPDLAEFHLKLIVAAQGGLADPIGIVDGNGGLDRPSAGEVWLADRRIDRLPERALAHLRCRRRRRNGRAERPRLAVGLG